MPMCGNDAALPEPVSTRLGVLHAPFTSHETNGWFTALTLFRYTSAAELSGATSTSGCVVWIVFDGPSTAAPGKIAPFAGAASSRQTSGVALSQCLVQGFVDQFIGASVLFPADR